MAVMASDGSSPHFPSLRLGLTALQPSRRHHAQSLLRPSFHDPRSVMFSNRTPSEPRLSPAATMSDDILSALTLPLHCASISQPATPPQVVAFESWTISAPICLNCYTLAESCKPNPLEKLLGDGFSTPMPLFCLIYTIISNKTCILD